MTTPTEQTARRVRRGLLWLGGGVAVLATVSAIVAIETRGQVRNAPAEPVAAQRPAGDFAAYERANAARHEGQARREAAAYDAYRAAHDEPLALRRLPDRAKR